MKVLLNKVKSDKVKKSVVDWVSLDAASKLIAVRIF